MTTRGFVIGCVVCLGLVAGCGDGATTSDTAPPTSGAVATSLPALGPMLLDVAEVGAAWQLGPEVTTADFTDATQLPCPDTAVNPTIADRLTPVAGVQFEPVDGSSRHLIEFVVTGEPERLQADLQVWSDAMDACASSTPTSTGTGSSTVVQFAIPELGDQRTAHELIGVISPDATWYVRRATVRAGSIAVTVSLTEILRTAADEPAIADDEFVRLVEAAVAALEA